MRDESSYIPPKVWQWDTSSGGNWAKINRPISGPTHEKTLTTGKHPFQLYSLATPNGVKVTVMLEELLAMGIKEAEYDAHLIDISNGDQFSSGFVEVNPNSKIPALLDVSNGKTRLFESGSILLYLAEKFDVFLPKNIEAKAECMSWLFWQMGSAPYLGGGFGHFYAYAPDKIEYCINRFSMEVKRQLDVLDKHLENNQYICGDEYTIADIAIWPWYGALMLNRLYDAAEFLNVTSYKNLMRWAKEIDSRPAVKRGVMVNKTWGELSTQLHERHEASDFINKTQDKLTDDK
ncbi:MAG: glutathione-dependent disulfide-bond oxidoreductase [Colwellia polaris]|jgi:GST-like protein|uniref:glutathione-dependent disulfide-bond oxidoreductase n=1 Tax=Colwellia polaris TaxID=326537 RepID=UPI000A178753|nr:glutathione-dependent disulfide-bond oxidoreductase [Colwellia polaris]|tara:strand:- start:3724 stop:4596 length:873 start_codon:yes stop_codon:yes gene_type:complete